MSVSQDEEGSFSSSVGLLELLAIQAQPSPRLARIAREVARFATDVARALSLEPETIQQIRMAALLHQVGRWGLALDFLDQKIGSLSRPQREQMRRYPELGGQTFLHNEALRPMAMLIRHHRERIDGLGIPDGLKGDAIPLGARILAVCEAFVVSRNEAIAENDPLEHARSFLLKNVGKFFDNTIVEAFLDQELEQRQILEMATHLSTTADKVHLGLRFSEDLFAKNQTLLAIQGESLSPHLMQHLALWMASGAIEETLLMYEDPILAEQETRLHLHLPTLGSDASKLALADPQDPFSAYQSEMGRVIIVDPDLYARQRLEKHLVAAGFEVRTVDPDDSLLTKVRQLQPVLAVVLEIALPNGRGLEFCQQIAKGPSGLRTPVLVYSKSQGKDDVQTALKQGAKDYILKPLPTETVMYRDIKAVLHGLQRLTAPI